jgi:hypothetical protein
MGLVLQLLPQEHAEFSLMTALRFNGAPEKILSLSVLLLIS